jgi:outer membrane biosynthesis protein TonB
MDTKKLVDQVAQSVRDAIDEAQRQAEEIVGEAEAQAKRVREDAERIRADAEADARKRLDEVQSALKDLQGRLSGKSSSEVDPGPVTVPEPAPPQTPEPMPEPTPEPTPEPVPEPTPDPVPEPTPPVETPGTAETAKANGDAGSGDSDAAARLVAMKLALDGTPRQDAREQLAAEYEVADLDALLADVYSKAVK